MTSDEVAKLAGQLNTIDEKVDCLTVEITSLKTKREEWERQQGLGAKTQAALIAAAASAITALIASLL